MSWENSTATKQPRRIEPIFDASGTLRHHAPMTAPDDDRKIAAQKEKAEDPLLSANQAPAGFPAE